MTKGPLAKITGGCIIFMLFTIISVVLFAVVSIRRDNKNVEYMIQDVPAIIEIYNEIIAHPNFDTVSYTQDGHLTLLDSEENEIAQLSVTTESQLEALCNLDRIYRNDYGVIFSYGSNNFSTIPRIVFSGKSMEDIKNKRSENETVTKITNGVYMVIYRFDYERFISLDEIMKQLNAFVEIFITGAEEILGNEQ